MVTPTPEEVACVERLYANTEEMELTTLVPQLKTKKLELIPLRYIPDSHARAICYIYENMPFHGTKLDEWLIERDWDKCLIKVKHPMLLYSFHIYTDNGNVSLYNQRKLTNLGTSVYVMQYYMQNRIAFPLHFEPKHKNNGKTAIDLQIGVPWRTPLGLLVIEVFNKDKERINDYWNDKLIFNPVDLNDITIYNAEFDALRKLQPNSVAKIL